jgi:hypothetical protein
MVRIEGDRRIGDGKGKGFREEIFILNYSFTFL